MIYFNPAHIISSYAKAKAATARLNADPEDAWTYQVNAYGGGYVITVVGEDGRLLGDL